MACPGTGLPGTASTLDRSTFRSEVTSPAGERRLLSPSPPDEGLVHLRADPSEPVSGRENPAVKAGLFACTGSLTIIEPILMIIEKYICLVFKCIAELSIRPRERN